MLLVTDDAADVAAARAVGVHTLLVSGAALHAQVPAARDGGYAIERWECT